MPLTSQMELLEAAAAAAAAAGVETMEIGSLAEAVSIAIETKWR